MILAQPHSHCSLQLIHDRNPHCSVETKLPLICLSPNPLLFISRRIYKTRDHTQGVSLALAFLGENTGNQVDPGIQIYRMLPYSNFVIFTCSSHSSRHYQSIYDLTVINPPIAHDMNDACCVKGRPHHWGNFPTNQKRMFTIDVLLGFSAWIHWLGRLFDSIALPLVMSLGHLWRYQQFCYHLMHLSMLSPRVGGGGLPTGNWLSVPSPGSGIWHGRHLGRPRETGNEW